MNPPHPRLGVSSWSLHHSLTRADFALTDLPQLAANHGLSKIEVCDFHIVSTDKPYLDEYRQRCADAGVEFYTLLKDSGDITHPDPVTRQSEIESVMRSIDIAAALGASRIRVIAGDAEPSPASLELSAEGLLQAASHAKACGVRVVIENWHRLLDSPADVLRLLDLTHGEVGLKLDFGNWPAPRKYDDLALIAPKAECTHAKANYKTNGSIDLDDFNRCLQICNDGHFDGPHILIYDSGGDEWGELDKIRDIVLKSIND